MSEPEAASTDPAPAAARLTIHRTAGWDEQSRQILCSVDGKYLGQLLFGLFVGLSSPLELSFRQVVTPDRLQGRMNATIRSWNWGMIAIGAPVGGLLADQLGARVALGIGIAGVALAAAGLTLSPFRRVATAA